MKTGDEVEWEVFLKTSNNGTLFHDLRFLAYHPVGRFRFEHLTVRRDGRLLALLPGGIAEDEYFASPLGASIGGPVTAAAPRTEEALALIAALQAWVRDTGRAGLRLTLPPALYHKQPSDTLSFALHSSGFRLAGRWLCPVVPITAAGPERYRARFRPTAANRVRAGLAGGIQVQRGGQVLLEPFLDAFNETYARHGVDPTHSPAEIADLLNRCPDRVSLHIAMHEGSVAAGVMVLRLTPHVATTFYICTHAAHMRDSGTLVVIAALLDELGEEGFRWLDLGPSASTGRLNAGVMFFKEGLGALGYCRDRWEWPARGL